MMKTKHTMFLLTLCGALALSAGCGRQETTPLPEGNNAASPTNAAAQKQMEDANAEAMRQQAAADKLMAEKEAVEKTAADKVAQVAATADQEQARIAGLIETAKNLSGQNKYAEALKVLAELSNLHLSPEQQAVVAGLKKTAEQQVAKAAVDKASAGAVSALGDALGGKK